VVSANQCVRKKNLPGWIGGQGSRKEEDKANRTPSQAGEQRHGSGRRRSTITLTEDKHEICWPIVEPIAETDAKPINGDFSAIEEDGISPASSTILPPKSKSKSTTSLSRPQSSAGVDAFGDEFVCRGGSCIISPMGEVLAGPLWEVEDGGLLVSEVDFEDCERGRLDLDVAGSYSRNDSFHLTVDGLDLNPPP
jgi:nitrilase